MFRTQLIVVISLVSGFLLTFQLIALRFLVHEVTPEANHVWSLFYAVSNFAKENEMVPFIIDSHLLASIQNYTQRDGRDLGKDQDQDKTASFLWPQMLAVPERKSYCKILCDNRQITHLAIIAEQATTQQLIRFTGSLRAKGFLVLEWSDLDPTMLLYNLKASIPTHLLVLNERLDASEAHVIHIAIFHDRIGSGTHWWQGHLDLSDYHRRLLHRQGVRRNQFRITDHAAIYEKTQVIPAIVDGVILGLPSKPQVFMGQPDEYKFIECDTRRAKEFYDKHPRDESRKAQDFRSRAYNVIKKASLLLDRLGIPFWLSSGTLLGYLRQCDIFPWGVDVDLGIFARDYDPRLIDLFSHHDLALLHVFGRPADSFELSFHDNYAIKLDLFFFYEDYLNNGTRLVWNGGTDIETGQKFKYTFPSFDMCWTEFMDLKIRVPCQTKAYIAANYGPDWREPVKEWNWKTSPFNVEENGYWSRDEFPEVMQTYVIPFKD